MASPFCFYLVRKRGKFAVVKNAKSVFRRMLGCGGGCVALDFRTRKEIAPLVEFHSGVPFDLDKSDFSAVKFLQETLPQVGIFDGFVGGGFPSVLLPSGKPVVVDGVNNVGGVGTNLARKSRFDGRKRLYDGAKFHSVVGGLRLETADFLCFVAVREHCRPTACAGVARTCAVGVNGNFVHCFTYKSSFRSLTCRVLI